MKLTDEVMRTDRKANIGEGHIRERGEERLVKKIYR